MTRDRERIDMTKSSKLLQLNNNTGAPTRGMVSVGLQRGTVFTATIEDRALADNASIDMLVRPGPDLETIMAVSGAAGGDAEATIFEGTTVSDDGTPIPLFNRNRVLAGTILATGEVFLDPTITDDGTAIFGPVFAPGGTGTKDSVGAALSLPDQWLLDPTQLYLVRLQNLSGAVNPADLFIGLGETPES